MQRLSFAFMLVFLGSSVDAQSCPWMNSATASGILHGQTNLTVTGTSAAAEREADATCSYSSSAGGSLTIEVRLITNPSDFANSSAACANDARKLVGVGNEAVACTRRDGPFTVERAIGRVRNRVFSLRWTIPPLTPNSQLSVEGRQAILQNLAEEIAGRLF